MLGIGGSVRLTTDVLANGAYPTRVYSIHIISGATAAIVSLKEGSTGGQIVAKETGTASTGKTISYGYPGMLFPTGCFVDVDGNTTSVLVNCVREA